MTRTRKRKTAPRLKRMSERMRVVFMGTPDFAVPPLEKLYESGYEVVGVFTQPDRPKGRGNKVVMSPVKTLALKHSTPVFQPLKIRKDGVDALRALKPDLCVTAAFGQILSQEILDIPPLGTVNVHASLLPRHRGSAPIAHGLLMGDTLFGVTTMMTDKGIDTGDMLLSCETLREDMETCGELTQRLSVMGADLLIKTLKQLEDGTLRRIPQDESQHTYEPMLKKEMGDIDWTRPAQMIVNQILGLNPWPGARTGGLKLLRARKADCASGKPGEIVAADPKKGLVVKAGQDAVEIVQLQAAGGKPMTAAAYLLGHPMKTGDKIDAQPAQ